MASTASFLPSEIMTSHLRKAGAFATLIGLGWFGCAAVSTQAETIQYRYDAGSRLIRAQTFQRGVTWDYRYIHTLAENRWVQSIATTTVCADRAVCNGNFEQAFAMWEGTDNATLVAGYAGQGATVMQDATDSNIFQNIPGVFEVGKTYRATARCFAANGRSCHLFVDGQSQDTQQEWGGNGAWQQMSTPPVTLTTSNSLTIWLFADRNGEATYDDVQIEETTPYLCADLAVCNGDFERGFEYWFSLNNSQLTAGRTGTGVHIDTDANNSDIIQTIPGTFPAGATYRATAWCKASAGTTCRMFFGDSNVVNGPSYEHAGNHQLAGNGVWQQLSVTIAFTHQEQMQVYLYGGTGIVCL